MVPLNGFILYIVIFSTLYKMFDELSELSHDELQYVIDSYFLWAYKTMKHSGNLRQGSRMHCLEKCCFLKVLNNSAYRSEIWPTS